MGVYGFGALTWGFRIDGFRSVSGFKDLIAWGVNIQPYIWDVLTVLNRYYRTS